MSFTKVKLGELSELLNGGTPNRSVDVYYSGDIPWITSADVNSDFAEAARYFITSDAIKSSATRLVPKNNLLLVTRTGVGKVAITGVDLCINQDFTAIIPDTRKADLRYLFWFLRSRRNYFEAHRRGATIQGITRKVVADLEVPLPPLEQQKRIAAILDKADELRAKRRRAIAKLDELLKSVFLEMFTSNESKSWDTVFVESLTAEGKNKIRTGPFGSQLLHSEFNEDASGVLVLGIDNAVKNRFEWGEPRFITYDKYQELKRYTVYPGDVLITIMGTCGRVAIVPDDVPLAINTKHLCCITLNRTLCLPTYLKNCFLMHPDAVMQLSSSTRGAIMEGLNMGIIKDLKIPLAPLNLQERFCHFEEQIERQKSRLTASSNKYKHLFSSLQARAFSGDLTPDVLDEAEVVVSGTVQEALF